MVIVRAVFMGLLYREIAPGRTNGGAAFELQGRQIIKRVTFFIFTKLSSISWPNQNIASPSSHIKKKILRYFFNILLLKIILIPNNSKIFGMYSKEFTSKLT